MEICLTDLKLARKMKVKQAQVERPAQADLTDTGNISPTRTQGTGPSPSVKEKVKPASGLLNNCQQIAGFIGINLQGDSPSLKLRATIIDYFLSDMLEAARSQHW